MLEEMGKDWWEGKYILFYDEGKVNKTAATNSYRVYSKFNHLLLGHIRYWTPWRKFVFFPLTGMLFDKGCMEDIILAIDKWSGERTERLKKKKELS